MLSWLHDIFSTYSGIVALGLYVVLALHFHHEWRSDYHPLNGSIFRVFTVLACVKTWMLITHHRVINLYGTVWFINLVVGRVISIILSVLALIAFLYWYLVPKARKTWDKFTMDELLWYYVWNAKIWGDGHNSPVDETDDIHNAYYVTWAMYFELQKKDPNLKSLRPLLHHKHDGVRVLTARHLLWTYEKNALAVLEEVSRGENEVARVARDFLEQWRIGETPTDSEIALQFPAQSSRIQSMKQEKWSWWEILLWAYSTLYAAFLILTLVWGALHPYADNSGSSPTVMVILIILSLPILIFQILEGVRHLKDRN